MLVFQKLAMNKANYGGGFKEIDLPRDQVVHLAGDPTGICSVSLGLLTAVDAGIKAKVKAVAVDGVEPNQENISSGSYLISRPLLLVTKGLPKGNVKTFINWMLSSAGQKWVGDGGFVPVRR